MNVLVVLRLAGVVALVFMVGIGALGWVLYSAAARRADEAGRDVEALTARVEAAEEMARAGRARAIELAAEGAALRSSASAAHHMASRWATQCRVLAAKLTAARLAGLRLTEPDFGPPGDTRPDPADDGDADTEELPAVEGDGWTEADDAAYRALLDRAPGGDPR